MDRATVEVYERGATIYRDRPRSGAMPPQVTRFVERAQGTRLDLGSGPGVWTHALGDPVVALDAAHAMLRHVASTPLRVQADIEALPLRRTSIDSTLASKSMQHVPAERLPLALAELHRAMSTGAPFELVVFSGDAPTWHSSGDDLPGRNFWNWQPDHLLDVVRGAGFDDVTLQTLSRGEVDELHVSATRARMLPDFVRPGLRVLFCGYNPSLYAADHGVPFARPGNRFWPAALAAGLVTRDRDPWHAVRHDDVGFTDMVKRATAAAAELTRDELAAGVERVERVCDWLRPGAVCVLGIGAWRQVVDRKARIGWQQRTLGGRPVYVMPNPSGLNASTQHAGFVDHLTRVSGSAML